MTPDAIEEIRIALGITQEGMADLLQCDYVSYKRFATGARQIPRYIARSAVMLCFLEQKELLKEFKKHLVNTNK